MTIAKLFVLHAIAIKPLIFHHIKVIIIKKGNLRLSLDSASLKFFSVTWYGVIWYALTTGSPNTETKFCF